VRFIKHWRAIALGGVLAAIAISLIIFFWPGPSSRSLLACLPPGEGPTIYLDLGLLKKTGVLDQLAGKPGEEDADYRQFVEASGFDYRRDLDAVLVQWRRGTALFVLAGRFNQERLETYVRNNRGQCVRSFCSLQGSSPDRRISFQPLGRRLMAMSTGVDPMAAASIHQPISQYSFEPPSGPVWISLPASSLHAEADSPVWLSVLFDALQGAQRAVLTLELRTDRFELVLDAPCESNDKAKLIAERLTSATAGLKDLIVRSGRAPEPSSPAAALSVGTFRSEGKKVRGKWPLNRAFLEGLGK
jgi:hypothetical protein